jgi:CYTH domain-containing protein
MLEVEKTYLVKDEIKELILELKAQKYKVTRFYTKIKLCEEIGYKKSENKYLKIIKYGHKNSIKEKKIKITKKEYKKARREKISKIITKNCYNLKINRQKYKVSFYSKELKELILLRVKFKLDENINKSQIFNQLEPYIIKDVTDDERFKNKNLAQQGNPNKVSYNIYKIFRDIKNSQTKELSDTIFKQMDSYEAIKITLYLKYNNMIRELNNFIKTNNIKNLKSFVKSLKEIRKSLKINQNIFYKEKYFKINSHLSSIQKSIIIDDKLDAIKNNLKILEKSFNEHEINYLLTQKDHSIDEEKRKIKNFIHTREFSIILSQLEILIREKNGSFKHTNPKISINSYIKDKYKTTLKKVDKTINKYSRCNDIQSYKKIRKQISDLETILRDFYYLFDKKELQKVNKIISQTKSSLNNLNSLYKQTQSAKEMIKESKKELIVQNKLLLEIDKSKHIKKEKLYKEINIALDNFRNSKELLNKFT